jgi:hypothetical protein
MIGRRFRSSEDYDFDMDEPHNPSDPFDIVNLARKAAIQVQNREIDPKAVSVGGRTNSNKQKW